jgi:hypothetical protein
VLKESKNGRKDVKKKRKNKLRELLLLRKKKDYLENMQKFLLN